MASHDLARERAPLPVQEVCSRVASNTSQAADPRAKLSRAAVRWALTGLVIRHVTVARVAQALAVSWKSR